MVEQAAPVHGVQGVKGHLPRVPIFGETGIAQQENQVVGGGKLGRGAKPAPLSVKTLGKLTGSPPDKFPAGRTGPVFRLPAQLGGEALPSSQQPRPVLPPQAGRFMDQAQELCFRQVGTRPERLLFRGEQHSKRPAAGAVHEQARFHIHRVHVRALLPVHLYGEEGGVDGLGHGYVLKRLVGHNVAPVAGGITNAQKDRLIHALCFLEYFRIPGAPVYRVFRVL